MADAHFDGGSDYGNDLHDAVPSSDEEEDVDTVGGVVAKLAGNVMPDGSKVRFLSSPLHIHLSVTAVEDEAKLHVSRSVPVIINRLKSKLCVNSEKLRRLTPGDIFLDGIVRGPIFQTLTSIVNSGLVKNNCAATAAKEVLVTMAALFSCGIYKCSITELFDDRNCDFSDRGAGHAP